MFPSSNEVFYNPVQEFNRDLSSAVIRLFAEEFTQKKKEKLLKRIKKRGVKEAEEKDNAKGSDEEMTDNTEPRGTSEKGNTEPVGITVLEALAASGLRSVR